MSPYEAAENSLDRLAQLTGAAAGGEEKNAARLEAFEKKLEKIIDAYQDAAYTPALQKMQESLLRAKKEFQAKKFFVLVMGPVKSGKSTLVNIFARQYVSPTAAGECTALPAIIGAAGGEHLDRIIQYVAYSDLDGSAKKAAFETLVDAIRGIEETGAVKKNLRKTPSGEISEDNIRQAIQIDAENADRAMAVTIGISAGDFIKDNILLIDMPGLDGSAVNTRDDPILEAVAAKADLVIFVQSALSTLSKYSLDFLNHMFKNIGKKPPLRLILNVHDSQYFLKDDEIKKADREEPIRRIQRQIAAYSGDAAAVYELNLGMIYAHYITPERIKDDQRERIAEEVRKYEAVKARLIDTLDTERQRIREQNVVNNARKVLKEAAAALKAEIRRFQEEEKNMQDAVTALEALPAKLESPEIAQNIVQNENALLGFYQANFINDEVHQAWKEKINVVLSGVKERVKQKLTGDEWNRKIREAAERCAEKFPVKADARLSDMLDAEICRQGMQVFRQQAEEIAGDLFKITGARCAALDVEAMEEELTRGIRNMSRDTRPLPVETRDEAGGLRKVVASVFPPYRREDFNRSVDKLSDDGAIVERLKEYGGVLRKEFKNMTAAFTGHLQTAIREHNGAYIAGKKAEQEKLRRWIARLEEMGHEIET